MSAFDIIDLSKFHDDVTVGARLRTIEVARGAGCGPTTLAAFDAALRASGIANFNLLRLSSVIPPETHVAVVERASGRANGDWGDRLYVVLAEMRTDRPGREAWAGIGWVQDDETGRGLFVEHEGYSEEDVRSSIELSLGAMVEGRPETFGPLHMQLQGAVCDEEPVCALVAAVYESAPWSIDLRGSGG